MRNVANKKSSLYDGQPDAEILATLSKAALLDLLVEQLRLAAGHCDTPVDAEYLRVTIAPTLADRGDKMPTALKGGAA